MCQECPTGVSPNGSSHWTTQPETMWPAPEEVAQPEFSLLPPQSRTGEKGTEEPHRGGWSRIGSGRSSSAQARCKVVHKKRRRHVRTWRAPARS